MAKIYKPRLTKPLVTDKYWIHSSCGGLNECIKIAGDSTLANCVGYAWGRWYEILGKRPNLARTNAETIYPKTQDGYKRGQTPKLGAAICWSQGSTSTGNDGCGHIAIVEEIYDDGSFLISESNYGYAKTSALYWRTKKIGKDCKYATSTSLKFQGFIYLPEEFISEKEAAKPAEILPTFTVGKIYYLQYALNVRVGAGTGYAKKSYLQLSANARKNATLTGVLKKGTAVSCLEVKKLATSAGTEIWVRIPSGWICAYQNKAAYIK